MYIMCHRDLNTCSELAGISLEWCFFLCYTYMCAQYMYNTLAVHLRSIVSKYYCLPNAF